MYHYSQLFLSAREVIMINDIMQINSNQSPWPGGLAWVRQDPDRNQGKLCFCREECGLSAVSVIFFFGQLKKRVTDRCMDGRTDGHTLLRSRESRP